MTRSEWWKHGNCADHDVELFITDTHHMSRSRDTQIQLIVAKGVCNDCLVKSDCLEAEYAEDDRSSIRGGLTPTERRALRRKQTATA
jgi:hypothetical protein